MSKARGPVKRPGRVALRRIRATSATRLRIGFLIIAMTISVFAVRLLQLQGVDAKQYAAQARAMGLTSEVLAATRGTITDRNGQPLAESLDGEMIVADPTKTSAQAPEIATIISQMTGTDYFTVLQGLRNVGSEASPNHFQYIARRVPSSTADAVIAKLKEQKLAGVSTRSDPIRTYPAHDVAANIVGFTNAEGQAGEGAELLFDKVLKGTDGSQTFETGGGQRIPLGSNSLVPAVDGQDIALTIDQDVQWYTQRVLRDTILGSNAKAGTALALDVKTGEILGLADYPTFDANDASSADKADLGARSVRNVYEPGSVEKVLTMATLIDAGLVSPATKLSVPGKIASSDKFISDAWVHGTTHYTLAGVLAKSSNVGTVIAARSMGAQQLYDKLKTFGLGSATGVGMAGESAGVLPDWNGWRQINKDNIAFGQGVAVTAVQMAAAVNTIANGGVYIQPSIVKGKATTNDGTVVGSDVAQRRQVVSPATAAAVTSMMENVPDAKAGSAPAAAIEGYNVAGKTGTAQEPGGACGCYAQGSHTLSFIGFAPADAPRFLVYVVIHAPSGGSGGTVAGPAFHKIMSYLLGKYAVPPTGVVADRPPITW